MDALEATSEFPDWEFLQSSSDSDITPVGSISGHEIASGGILNADYFSLDACNRSEEPLERYNSARSDIASSVSLGLEENSTGCVNEDSGEFLSGISCELAAMDLSEIDQSEMSSEVVEDILEEATGELSDCSGEETNGCKIVENKRGGELEKRSVVWWKMPLEFLKYFGFRMSPLWTFSVVAAAIGIVILSSKLYKMKKKSKGQGIKFVVDDKMISQTMSRASRLNEALSVVKRVSLIRPSHPAVGATTSLPVMSFR